MIKLASRPGAAPGKLSFGDSAARAGARLIGNRNALKRERVASRQLVRLPGVAPGHSPWRGDILLLNHSRKESKRAGSCVSLLAVRKDFPARAISTKNKHLLVIFSDPNPRFHGGSFGV